MEDLISQIEPMIPALRRYARGMIGDRDTADDVVQDCLEKVVSHWGRRKNDDPRTWVFTILHNLAVNRIRQRSRRGVAVDLDDVPETAFASEPTQDRNLFGKEVMNAMDTLPEDQKGILLMVSVEDLTYAEASKVLGVPVGTVMSRLSRAREKLRQALEKPKAAKPNLWRVK
jgi:RNA polymerase sigma-70 factor (ECF subfamily)